MWSITGGSVITDTTVISIWHLGQRSGSTSRMRRKSLAHEARLPYQARQGEEDPMPTAEALGLVPRVGIGIPHPLAQACV